MKLIAKIVIALALMASSGSVSAEPTLVVKNDGEAVLVVRKDGETKTDTTDTTDTTTAIPMVVDFDSAKEAESLITWR